MVPILSLLVESIVKKHNQKLLISEIIREIKRIDIRELSRDASGPRAISLFLTEVSDKCPQEMMSSTGDLLDFLEEDSYLMRNATLSIIGNLIIKELSGETVKERHLRDQLLDKLEDHIHDNTSYTRSRALHVWCNLCQAEVIPLSRLETLIEAVIGRLKDKSCYVRKYAVQFLNQFLTKNPFAAKLPLQLLQTYHQKEEEKLKLLIASTEQSEQLNDENQSQESKELQESEDSQEPKESNDSKESEEPEESDQLIKSWNTCGKAIEKRLANHLNGNREKDQHSRPITTTIEVANSSTEGLNDDSAVNDISRQQIVVKYLSDCMKFTEQMQISMPLISELLLSRNISDVQEAIEFFVSAYKFGVQEAIKGVRKLILLIWSQEKSIKEAAITAYKRIYLDFENSDDDQSEKAKAFSVVKSLSELVMGATLG